jgi:hypothetical protein
MAARKEGENKQIASAIISFLEMWTKALSFWTQIEKRNTPFIFSGRAPRTHERAHARIGLQRQPT